MTRAAIIVVVLVLAVASAGTVLCEMDCIAGRHAASPAAVTDDAASVATSHCAGELIQSMPHEMPSPHGSSGGNTKHSGVHLHPRIQAITIAKIQISSSLAFSGSVVTRVPVSVGFSPRNNKTSWNSNSSPPINSPSFFASGVLRI
jgi:hypothetical protein